MGKASLDRACDCVHRCWVWPQRDSTAAHPNANACATDTDANADTCATDADANANSRATNADANTDANADGNHSAALSSQ